jgi:hypothetical protein
MRVASENSGLANDETFFARPFGRFGKDFKRTHASKLMPVEMSGKRAFERRG